MPGPSASASWTKHCLGIRGFWEISVALEFSKPWTDLGLISWEAWSGGANLWGKKMHFVNAIKTNTKQSSTIFGFFSRKDIHAIARCGCPSIDRKVVNSGKRLRAHVGIDEGNVCSSCKFRGDCERAYVKAREYEGGRTVDVMRILLTYGFNSLSGNLENRPFDNKMVKDSTAKALNAPSNTSTPLEHDSGGLPNHRRLRFVHGDHKGDDDKSMQLDRMKQRRGVDRWRFVEEEREDNHLWNKDSSFVDFPIVGGQSSLSRNSQNGERWKLEMLQKSRTTGRTGESDEESRRADTQRRFKFLETTDDEDMAEWFGHTK
ncbi:hypothetical protein GH714_007044 [Hevea brasiliensis]|uniref:Uncharacterized protein n=1 Tax=Hevea brasiliensis TaxID=3981 RepID=A0A6A6LVX6_HEVBR|nr:hypothetical protein GH714_007044 [Hevea brasiliensis]